MRKKKVVQHVSFKMAEDQNNISQIAFKVDAGLIDRLGRELVGKAETAVSELIKNSYDADATYVTTNFIDSEVSGGTLEIKDNGLGMNMEQLVLGFMTISSTDKVHFPKSIRFNRNKAGKKGIGRFATQRLGSKLTIITQTLTDEKAIKLVIDWDRYTIDTEISTIYNEVEFVEKQIAEGTILIIENLREPWNQYSITRVYRYVSDLLQPDYLSDRSQTLGLASQKDESFKVDFNQIVNGEAYIIADPDKMIFDKALVTIEGYIDNTKDGYCAVNSESLKIDQEIIEIAFNKPKENPQKKYTHLKNIHFKAYYFIYNRTEYYTNISKIELTAVQRIAQEQGGIRLYRNGFRVLPYGEPNDDWLNIDRRYYDESGVVNVPFGNHNLFGFVEVIDSEGDLFQETASREGLIENEAYLELKDFISKALEAGHQRIRHGVNSIRKEIKNLNPVATQNVLDFDKSPLEKIAEFKKSLDIIIGNTNATSDEKENYERDSRQFVENLKEDFKSLIQELGMLRVLAGLGLTISEFTHEVVQFAPSMNGDLSVIDNQSLNVEGANALENLKRTIRLFIAYTSYFSSTVSANVSRELKSQQIDVVVESFLKIISTDLNKEGIELEHNFYGYKLNTVPMHSSEWSSILFNLYTNAKKAIKRAGVMGKISIIGGYEEGKVYLEFSDNGDGIPEKNKQKIFDAFFTTSSPAGYDASVEDKSTGTGLGLKIVQDILQSYRGSIKLIEPEKGYETCFKIEIPSSDK